MRRLCFLSLLRLVRSSWVSCSVSSSVVVSSRTTTTTTASALSTVRQYRSITMSQQQQQQQQQQHKAEHYHMDTEEREDNDTNPQVPLPPSSTSSSSSTSTVPIWDPIQQIYINGAVPSNVNLQDLLNLYTGDLYIFGYGSLCWNPGRVGRDALADPSVTQSNGQAMGYRRCWAQKSTDHRGCPSFPGIVCTLLTEKEYQHETLSQQQQQQQQQTTTASRAVSMTNEPCRTEGVLFRVPKDLVQVCLEQLDFREKGGYTRDIIHVRQDDTGTTIQALLYRGTPDNPALWKRPLHDLVFAAATMSVAVGPSGTNSEYLQQLDDFLEHASTMEQLQQYDDTFTLARMVQQLQPVKEQLVFFMGSGSNQHNQLLLRSKDNVATLRNGQDAIQWTECLACLPEANDWVVQLYAGGGHSAMLTQSGRLLLFGWNESGQLGSPPKMHDPKQIDSTIPIPVLSELKGIHVKDAALGFSHTLIIEQDTHRLYAFGDNTRGQVDGRLSDDAPSYCFKPMTPLFCGQHDAIVSIAAGVFHSAAVTDQGELLTFGYLRSGVAFSSDMLSSNDSKYGMSRWKPLDGSRIVQVACGQHHTVALDHLGRLWTFGDNTYGQLGRTIVMESAPDETPKTKMTRDLVPRLVSVSETFDSIVCGWSHCFAMKRNADSNHHGMTHVYGWGRNDKGQLGTGTPNKDDDVTAMIPYPTLLWKDRPTTKDCITATTNHEPWIQSIVCGSESSHVLDIHDTLWACGWNEHGNLGMSMKDECCSRLTQIGTTRIPTTPCYGKDVRTCMAAGGAHVLAMNVRELQNN